jgi:hypothetical protein
MWGAHVGRAQAQAVYKCNSRTYSEQPCSTRVVRTYDAPVPPSPKPANVGVRQLPGETVAEFNTRRHRAGLSETDRDECARLDKRIPVEQERLKKGAQEEDVDDAQASLAESRKRFRQLRC